MTSAILAVAEAGPFVTIQDGGRPGLMRFGVPASGPMDRAGFRYAQAALGNRQDAAAIEISLGGVALDCLDGSVTIALAGGGFRAAIDGAAIAGSSVATLRAGSRLTIRPGDWGSWCYLAFAGRLNATGWLGSAATYSIADLGGGGLVAGQRLVVDAAEILSDREGTLPLGDAVRPPDRVRVVLGPQQHFFTPEAIARLTSEPYTLTDAYDRMGVRLSGPSLGPLARLDMPSEALVRGSVQVAGDGLPTILLADHQTTGGYPKIATLISADLDQLAQRRAGDSIRFVAVTPEAAIAAARQRHARVERQVAILREGALPLEARLMRLNLVDGVVRG
ncbi:MAG: biotin-dependent carboxyltransferase family protein [Ancalomicrobiaceae bacterium]|nr:biotin-dependent carboxyltransferase family protein [Ancalomicrobiaceae bacterium]